MARRFSRSEEVSEGDLNPHGLAPTSTSSRLAMSSRRLPAALRLLKCTVGMANGPSGDGPRTPHHRVGLQKWLQRAPATGASWSPATYAASRQLDGRLADVCQGVVGGFHHARSATYFFRPVSP